MCIRDSRRSDAFYGLKMAGLVAGALDRLQPFVDGLVSELLFDADQLVVLADTVGA